MTFNRELLKYPAIVIICICPSSEMITREIIELRGRSAPLSVRQNAYLLVRDCRQCPEIKDSTSRRNPKLAKLSTAGNTE